MSSEPGSSTVLTLLVQKFVLPFGIIEAMWEDIVRAVVPVLALALCMLFSGSVETTADPLPDPLPCKNCFIGKLVLSDNPNDPGGQTKVLSEDLYFVDPDEFVWKAGQGDITDGASIPPLFQPIIGGPWEPDYLPAAVMHDHYTNITHRVRPWRPTDLMFYQAMLAKLTDTIKAKLMYYAVYAFGPHWDKLGPGTPCGRNCTFEARTSVSSQGSDYDVSHADELQQVQSKIADAEFRGVPLNLDQLGTLATANHPTNIFLKTDNSNTK